MANHFYSLTAAALLTGLLSACATRLPDATPVSAQAQCCSRLGQYQFSSLPADGSLTLAVSEQSAKFRFDSFESRFVGLRWDDVPGQKLEVSSYVVDDKLFVPNILFMDEQFKLLDPPKDEDGWISMVENKEQFVLRKQTDVPAGTRYLLAYTSERNLRMGVQFWTTPIMTQSMKRQCVGTGTDCSTLVVPVLSPSKPKIVEASAAGLLKFKLVPSAASAAEAKRN